MASLSLRVSDHEHTIENRSSNTEEPSFFRRVADVRTIQGSGVGEGGRGLVERDAVLDEIRRSLLRVPLEHAFSIYRIRGSVWPRGQCGRICWKQRKVNLSRVFAGQTVRVKQVSDRIWLASLVDYDLECVDDETRRLEAIDNPFGPKLLPMSPE